MFYLLRVVHIDNSSYWWPYITLASDGRRDRHPILGKVRTPASDTSLPFSPTISSRLVPGASPVVVMNTLGTVWIFEVGSHLIFDLNVVMLPESNVSCHAARHSTDPLHKIKLMWALVCCVRAPPSPARRSPALRRQYDCVRNQLVMIQLTRLSSPSSPFCTIDRILMYVRPYAVETLLKNFALVRTRLVQA